jgi:acetyltransferase-like isoleucine patch superfamily enzyme
VVGERSFLGVNSTLRNSITIAPESLIAAGAVVMKNTEPKGVYYAERAKVAPKPSDEIDL